MKIKLTHSYLLLDERFKDGQQWQKFTQQTETVGEIIVSASFSYSFYDSKQSVESCNARISFGVSSASWPTSFLVLFFDAAFPSKFKVTFTTVTKFMYKVVSFKTFPVSKVGHCVSQNVFHNNYAILLFYLSQLFSFINNFFKKYI